MEGHVIAEMTDYIAVRALIADLIADGVGATVTQEIRETVAAVEALGAGDRPIPLVELARRLQLDKSAVSRRVAKAIERGYLENQEKTKGKPAKLVIGDSLPDEALVLPDPAILGRCTVASVDQATEIHAPSPHPEPIHRRAIL